MSMFFDTFITLFIAAIIVGTVWLLYGRFLRPIQGGNGEKLYTIVYACGKTPNLDITVKSLIWLHNIRQIESKILIVDGGMDDESLNMAGLILRDFSEIQICKASELDEILAAETEEECRKRNMTY